MPAPPLLSRLLDKSTLDYQQCVTLCVSMCVGLHVCGLCYIDISILKQFTLNNSLYVTHTYFFYFIQFPFLTAYCSPLHLFHNARVG